MDFVSAHGAMTVDALRLPAFGFCNDDAKVIAAPRTRTGEVDCHPIKSNSAGQAIQFGIDELREGRETRLIFFLSRINTPPATARVGGLSECAKALAEHHERRAFRHHGITFQPLLPRSKRLNLLVAWLLLHSSPSRYSQQVNT